MTYYCSLWISCELKAVTHTVAEMHLILVYNIFWYGSRQTCVGIMVQGSWKREVWQRENLWWKQREDKKAGKPRTRSSVNGNQNKLQHLQCRKRKQRNKWGKERANKNAGYYAPYSQIQMKKVKDGMNPSERGKPASLLQSNLTT